MTGCQPVQCIPRFLPSVSSSPVTLVRTSSVLNGWMRILDVQMPEYLLRWLLSCAGCESGTGPVRQQQHNVTLIHVTCRVLEQLHAAVLLRTLTSDLLKRGSRSIMDQ